MGKSRKEINAAAQARRVHVSELYLQGLMQSDIASRMSDQFGYPVSQQVISKDLKVIRSEWRATRVANYEAKQDLELARIDQVEREAWDAWARSIGRYVTTTEKNGKDGVETTKKIEKLAGDPRFLQVVQACVQKRCEILGLNEPTRSSVEITAQGIEALVEARRKKLQELPTK